MVNVNIHDFNAKALNLILRDNYKILEVIRIFQKFLHLVLKGGKWEISKMSNFNALALKFGT